jgi:hypothetical protein
MTTGFGVATKAEHAKGFCVLSGALARQVMDVVNGVSGAVGSAAAGTVPARQKGAASVAVRTTWPSKVDAARMLPSPMAIDRHLKIRVFLPRSAANGLIV